MAKIVGSGAVRVFPVMTGFKKSVTKEMGSAGKAGASGFSSGMKGAGVKAGTELGKELASSAKASTKGIGQDIGVKQLQDDVASSSQALSKARIQLKNANAQAITAENAYTQAVAKHGETSSQAMAAGERLAAAQERLKLAQIAVTAATGNLKNAQEGLAEAEKAVEASNRRVTDSLKAMATGFKTGFADMNAVKSETAGMSTAVGGLAKAITGPAVNALNRFRSGLTGTAKPIDIGLDGIVRFGAGVRTMASSVASVGTRIATPFKNALPIVQQLGDDLSYGLTQRLNKLPETVGRIAGKLPAPIRNAVSGMSGYFGEVSTAAGNVLNRIPGVAKTAAGGLSSAFQTAGAKAKDALSGIGTGLRNIATISVAGIATGVTAIGGALAGVGKSALQAYATYEQAVGGIDTLFKDSSKTVQSYAANAYKTAGVSANAYMQQITSFSASLISSLGGDTAKAAEMGNQAVIDMSDNANKMGTDLQSIQETYQSLARGNYEMLDNLKLGYGGTKTEMQRLISDANKVKQANGEMADLSIDSFADVTEAIHIIQTEMGITGTTAKEAATTIEGSVNSMKSAWSNWITGLGNEDADMGQLTDQLVDSVVTALKNIVPRAGVIAKSVVQALPTLFADIVGLLPEPFQTAVDAVAGVIDRFKPIVASLSGAFVALGAGGLSPLLSNLPIVGNMLGGLTAPLTMLGGPLGIITAAIGGLVATTPSLQTLLQGVLADGFAQIQSLVATLQPSVDQILATVSNAISSIMPTLIAFVGQIITLGGQLFASVVQIASAALPPLMDAFNGVVPILATVITVIMQVVTAIAGSLGPIIQQLAPIVTDVFNTAGQIIKAFQPVVQSVVTAVGGFITGTLIPVFKNQLMPAVSSVISAVQTIIRNLQPVVMTVVNAIVGFINNILLPGFKAMEPYISGVINAVGGIIRGIVGVISGIFSMVSNLIHGNWQGAWNSFLSIGRNAVGAIGSALSGIKNAVLGALSGAGTWLVESGKSIINGLISGIQSMVGGAVSKVSGVLSSIRDLFPFSPAKKGPFSGRGWVLYSGRSISTAFGQGVEDTAAQAENAVRDVMRRAQAAADGVRLDYRAALAGRSGAGSRAAAAAGGGQMVINQTITGDDPRIIARLSAEQIRRSLQ